MATFWQDLRYSVRTLWKRPGFTLTVVITLALGIGANATIFTWIKAVLLNPLPGIERPDQLVEIWGATRHSSALSTSYLDYLDFRDRNTTLSSLAGHQMLPMSLGRGDQVERVRGAVVSGNYFDVLGVKPVLGRGFLPEEDRTPNSHPVAVISYGLWQRLFGSDRNVIGQKITLNEHDFTITGVAPAAFESPFAGYAIDVWTPVMMKDYVARPHFSLTDRGSRWLMVIGRLKPDATVSQAQANMTAIARQLEEAYPRTDERLGVEVYSVERSPYSLKRSLQSSLAVLMAAVTVVLLIACANVANLLLARAASRRKEIAVRVALGGSRACLTRQMLTESLVLATFGSAVGLTLAFWTTHFLPVFLSFQGTGGILNTRPDASVFLFTVALTVVATALFGLAPALQASHPNLVTALKETTGMAGYGPRRLSLRHGLVVTQVALSMVALISAGLFVRSLRAAYHTNPGFDSHNVLLAAFDPFLSGYDENHGREFYRHLLERTANLPGIQSATLARRLPLTGGGIAFANVTVDGYAPAPGEDMRLAYETTGPSYFQTMRIPLASGRDFDERDNEHARRVAVVNETMARRYWPKGNALGKRLKLTNDWLEVIGIAKDIKNRSLRETPEPFLYVPLFQDYRSNMILVARTVTNPDRMIHAMKSAAAALDNKMPLFDIETLDEHIGISLVLQRMAATLLSIFGLLALALAALGLYGVMAYAVNQRTREIGIRISIGARRSDVLRLILGQAVLLATMGMMGGLAAAFAVTRFAASLLYGISPADPMTFLLVAVILLVVALAASYLPARRATRIDPMIALRSE